MTDKRANKVSQKYTTAKTVWRPWFAWRPVTLTEQSSERIWLRWIERRWTPAYAHDKGNWEYRRR